MRCWIQIIAISLLLSKPLTALGQSPDLHAMAEDQFRRGRNLAFKGDCKPGLRFFRTSQGLEPNRNTLLNIALCEDQLGRIASALQHFQEVAPQFGANDERRSIATRRIAALAPQVPHLRIDLASSAPEGAVVKLDDVRVAAASLGTSMPIDPGSHVVTVSATGLSDGRYDVRSEAGKDIELSVAPGPRVAPMGPALAPLAAPAPVRSVPVPRSEKRIGFVAGAVGVAGVGIGAALGVTALLKHAALEAECPSHTGCSKETATDGSQGNTLSIASTVVLAAGLAGVGVGTFLVLRGDQRKATTGVAVTMTPGGGRLGLFGSF